MLSALAKLIKVLNSETEPGQISLGFAFAMIAGFTPLLSLHNLLVLLLILILRVNLSAFLIGLAFFTGVAYLIDPLFHTMGLAALTSEGLKGLWTAMYNSTFWRIEHFNNTIVMGSLLISLILFIPLILISNILIRKYREHVLQWILKSRIAQVLKASKFYQTYQRISGWGGSS